MTERPRVPRDQRLDQPLTPRRGLGRTGKSWLSEERFGVWSERFARFMGTSRFLIGMTLFVVIWLSWNVLAPQDWRFDPYAFIFLTLVLSLQASYAAPLILLAQNRQDDRDRVALEQDRVQAERALADTEYLTREVAALRIALRESATRDFVRSELRGLLEELDARAAQDRAGDPEREAEAAQVSAEGAQTDPS